MAKQEVVSRSMLDLLTTFCKGFIPYNNCLRVQGLVGITVDDGDIILVQIDELCNKSETSVTRSLGSDKLGLATRSIACNNCVDELNSLNADDDELEQEDSDVKFDVSQASTEEDLHLQGGATSLTDIKKRKSDGRLNSTNNSYKKNKRTDRNVDVERSTSAFNKIQSTTSVTNQCTASTNAGKRRSICKNSVFLESAANALHSSYEVHASTSSPNSIPNKFSSDPAELSSEHLHLDQSGNEDESNVAYKEFLSAMQQTQPLNECASQSLKRSSSAMLSESSCTQRKKRIPLSSDQFEEYENPEHSSFTLSNTFDTLEYNTSMLESGSRVHVKEEPLECATGQDFIKQETIQPPRATKTKNRFACSVCGKRFTYRHSLESHLRVEHDTAWEAADQECLEASVTQDVNLWTVQQQRCNKLIEIIPEEFFHYVGPGKTPGNSNFLCKICSLSSIVKPLSCHDKSKFNLRKHVQLKHPECLASFDIECDKISKRRDYRIKQREGFQ